MTDRAARCTSICTILCTELLEWLVCNREWPTIIIIWYAILWYTRPSVLCTLAVCGAELFRFHPFNPWGRIEEQLSQGIDSILLGRGPEEVRHFQRQACFAHSRGVHGQPPLRGSCPTRTSALYTGLASATHHTGGLAPGSSSTCTARAAAASKRIARGQAMRQRRWSASRASPCGTGQWMMLAGPRAFARTATNPNCGRWSAWLFQPAAVHTMTRNVFRPKSQGWYVRPGSCVVLALSVAKGVEASGVRLRPPQHRCWHRALACRQRCKRRHDVGAFQSLNWKLKFSGRQNLHLAEEVWWGSMWRCMIAGYDILYWMCSTGQYSLCTVREDR